MEQALDKSRESKKGSQSASDDELTNQLRDFKRSKGGDASRGDGSRGDGSRGDGSKGDASRGSLPERAERASTHQFLPAATVGKESIDFGSVTPTIGVLDEFTPARREPTDTSMELPAHGEIISRIAEADGYKVQRIPIGGEQLLPDALNDLNAKIERGEIKLGKGDFLNISRGIQSPPTFKDLSDMVGFEVTPANLAENRDRLLQKFRTLSKDDNSEHQFMADYFIRTNDAIARIQAHGIKVMTSAGNDGPDHLKPDFLRADFQFSSNRPDGKPHQFSGWNSMSTPSDGILGFKVRPWNALSDEPIARQKGEWEDVASGARFPITGHTNFANLGTDPIILDRKVLDGLDGEIFAPKEPFHVPPSSFSPRMLAGKNEFRPYSESVNNDDALGANAIPGLVPGPDGQIYLMRSKVAEHVVDSGAPLSAAPHAKFAFGGTSFSFADDMKKNLKRYSVEKARALHEL